MANEFFNGSDFSQVGLYRGYKWKKILNTWTHKNFSLIVGHTTPIKNLNHSKEMPP